MPTVAAPTLRAALAAILPALPIRGSARLSPATGGAVRVALRFSLGAGEGAQRAAVAHVVAELRDALLAGVAADGVGPEGERFVRVVGA